MHLKQPARSQEIFLLMLLRACLSFILVLHLSVLFFFNLLAARSLLLLSFGVSFHLCCHPTLHSQVLPSWAFGFHLLARACKLGVIWHMSDKGAFLMLPLTCPSTEQQSRCSVVASATCTSSSSREGMVKPLTPVRILRGRLPVGWPQEGPQGQTLLCVERA